MPPAFATHSKVCVSRSVVKSADCTMPWFYNTYTNQILRRTYFFKLYLCIYVFIYGDFISYQGYTAFWSPLSICDKLDLSRSAHGWKPPSGHWMLTAPWWTNIVGEYCTGWTKQMCTLWSTDTPGRSMDYFEP